MDPVRNPFAPGAGSQPPELAGRHAIIDEARIALSRVIQGRASQSQLLLGLRGVGKTVLLNRIEELAHEAGYLTSFIEAPEDRPLPELLYPKLHQMLRKLSMAENAKAKAVAALRALKAFAGAFKVSVGDVSIAYEPEEGTADSGDLDADLSELFLLVGQAAREAGKGWALLIDEVQYLGGKDLSALIVALHRVNQKNLPIIFFGAGLPQLAGMAGDAKSYAERLFTYPPVDALDAGSARQAIRQPVEDEEQSIEDEAVAAIVDKTHGYPYFLQEWGFQAWNHALGPCLLRAAVEMATQAAMRRLDEGFFNVRLERLTPREREYVYAMASLGAGPYRSNDVAHCLGDTTQSLGPCRAKIISKGMIYSPAHGDIAFTVPMFDDFLRRNFPDRVQAVQKKYPPPRRRRSVSRAAAALAASAHVPASPRARRRGRPRSAAPRCASARPRTSRTTPCPPACPRCRPWGRPRRSRPGWPARGHAPAPLRPWRAPRARSPRHGRR